MIFTDNDLKQLIEKNGKVPIWHGPALGKYGNSYIVALSTQDISDLLTRLETAEDVIEDIESGQCPTVIAADIAVWKKASGKEPN